MPPLVLNKDSMERALLKEEGFRIMDMSVRTLNELAYNLENMNAAEPRRQHISRDKDFASLLTAVKRGRASGVRYEEKAS